MKFINRVILFFVLIVAALLRFYQFIDIPFTHDEWSALFRTDFENFQKLIENGVLLDGHPAGVQVFIYYWTKIFGRLEWVVKLPFAIMGIFSVWFIYLIAKEWYNETVGLISASFLASLQYTVMYSQLARPYISGLFFSLLMVFYWSKIIRPAPTHFWKNSFFFILASSLCAYNHHFSLLFAAIVGLSGLFFIQKKYLPHYILSGVLIVLIYLPHLNIFLYQLNIGGVGGWLGKPDIHFIFNYLYYIFHFSVLSVILVIALVFFGILNVQKENVSIGRFFLFASWVFLPLLIGFFYSTYFNPVLQFSVLIFGFPFLFFLLFGHIKEQSTKVNIIIVSVILGVNIFTLTVGRGHYDLFYNSPYEKIVVNYQEANRRADNIVSIIDSHKKITNFYLNKYDADSVFVWFDSFQNEADLISFLEDNNTATHLYLGCISSINPTAVSIIQDYFPVILKQKNYAGGTTYLFSKTGKSKKSQIEFQGFEKNESVNWQSINEAFITDSICYSGKYAYLVGSDSEWSPACVRKLNQIISNKNNFVDISVKTKIDDDFSEIILVAALESNGKTIHWSGSSFNQFIVPHRGNNEWVTVYHSLKLADMNWNYNNTALKIYIWNKGRNTFIIDDFRIRVRRGNPLLYGLYEPI